MECIWRIHVSKKHKVTFVFLRPLSFDPNCTDFLEIRDGLDSGSPLLNRYCASKAAPTEIFSSGRDLYVRFKSDSYIRGKILPSGFQATYFAVPLKSGRLNSHIWSLNKLKKSLRGYIYLQLIRVALALICFSEVPCSLKRENSK